MSNKTESTNTRYFNVDEGYDKRVYENDWKNILVIIAVFITFYGLNIIWFWGDVSLAMSYSDASMWFNVAFFVFTVLHFVAYLVYGRYSNKKRHLLEFYKIKIAERE